MNYEIKHEEGTKRFYEEIDNFFFNQHRFGHNGYPLFNKLVDYDKLKGKAVLEIGCAAFGPGVRRPVSSGDRRCPAGVSKTARSRGNQVLL